MKHIKHFEELNYRTYLSVAKELRRISPKKNKERYKELQNHADVIELKKRRNELSKISSPISIKITDTENSGKQGVGRFYPLLSPEYDTLRDYLADGTVESIPFTLVIVPADDETVEMCLNTMPEGDDLSVCGYGAMWLTIGLTLDEGTYELGRLKVVDMDQYVYGECELQGRAAYGGIKQTLYRMFSDKSSEFYQEFEETVIAGMGLSSDHGLSMDKIANHLNEELENHADVIELKKRRNELSKISSPISIKITDTDNGKQGVGRFYPLLSPEYDTLQDYLADGTVESIPFTLVIVPADDETVEMCLNTMPEGDDLSVCGYGAMWLTIGLTLDEGTYELGRLKVVDMDQYVYGECELQGRAAYGGIKQTLYRMFSDKSSEFYQEFEETVIAGMGLSSDHGLSMDKIANHLKSLSVNTGFIAD